ncbi:Zn-dependent protease (includes SpoIVFB) [Methylobacillus rhizosphaerae]|uniref:Zn-dependent protease (Includes SpoIVFB) n=1 Tax=Methylobacillus rhizosphaerae TaxID=551994 RepID=A0A239AS96_9PROT|nr:site-2 protease family protein [Methylobacillus rhizosphaerae]SNR97843.1 Zn-dependent protease (includes SpoIVFB) [Methylobacillus rhizosphaerae]
MELTLIQKIVIYALPVIFAITVHEAAHGYIARYFGDTTAESLGRITLNPIKHIDPIGTILVPALLVLSGTGFLFGWAKPVPVDYSRLRNPKQDMRWVAAAGPASNFLMAIFWALVYKFASGMTGDFAVPLSLMGQAGILVNIVLMVLNLLPLPPLDGGRIAVSLMPNQMAYKFAQIERYGFIILLVLMFTGILSKIMMPFIMLLLGMFAGIFG